MNGTVARVSVRVLSVARLAVVALEVKEDPMKTSKMII